MRRLRMLAARLGGWITRARRDRDLRRELAAHLDLHVADEIARGRSPDAARRIALLRLGGIDQTRDAMRDLWSVRWIETLWQDARYGLRGLRRAPAFSLTAILSLAVGLGGSLAIFTIADTLLLRPLPYPDADQLTMVWERRTRTDALAQSVVARAGGSVSPGNYFDWKAQNDVFSGMTPLYDVRSVLAVGGRVEELREQLVSADLLTVLRVAPAAGRWFTAEEDRPDANSAIVISHRVWQDWFAGAPDTVGRTVLVNSRPRTIAGIMPASFYVRHRDVDLWEPLALNSAQDHRKIAGRWITVLARLKPGIDRDLAQARMVTLAQRLEAAYPAFNKNWSVNVEPLRDSMLREAKSSVLVLLGAVALLLLAACANVAGLLLARLSVRRREIAVRASLGAGRLRVVRQLLTESLVLGLVSGLAGLALAEVLLRGLMAIAPEALAQGGPIVIDWRILIAGLGLTLATVLLFGLAPALLTTRASLMAGVRAGSRGQVGVDGAGGGRLRTWLVGAEVALCVVLLIGGVLLLRSLVGLQGVAPGLDPAQVLTVRVSLPGARYKEPERTAFFARAVEDLRHLPGVRGASAISYLPFLGDAAGTWFSIEGQPPARPGEELGAVIRTVTPGYFATMGIPLARGRDFTAADNDRKAPLRFIVNETFARAFLSARDPLATRISVMMARDNPFGEIIGIVGDVKEGAINLPPAPTVYYPHAYLPYSAMTLVLRAEGDPLALVEPVRRAIARIDTGQQIAQVRTMETVVGETIARQRFSAMLMVAFSAASLLLAAVGIYGQLAYAVSQRTREIGVRVALGAAPSRIVRLVLSAGARSVLLGAAAGVAGALALAGLLDSLLFGIAPRDPLTFVLVPLALTAIALAAAAIPARRAVRLNPTDALRAD